MSLFLRGRSLLPSLGQTARTFVDSGRFYFNGATQKIKELTRLDFVMTVLAYAIPVQPFTFINSLYTGVRVVEFLRNGIQKDRKTLLKEAQLFCSTKSVAIVTSQVALSVLGFPPPLFIIISSTALAAIYAIGAATLNSYRSTSLSSSFSTNAEQISSLPPSTQQGGVDSINSDKLLLQPTVAQEEDDAKSRSGEPETRTSSFFSISSLNSVVAPIVSTFLRIVRPTVTAPS